MKEGWHVDVYYGEGRILLWSFYIMIFLYPFVMQELTMPSDEPASIWPPLMREVEWLALLDPQDLRHRLFRQELMSFRSLGRHFFKSPLLKKIFLRPRICGIFFRDGCLLFKYGLSPSLTVERITTITIGLTFLCPTLLIGGRRRVKGSDHVRSSTRLGRRLSSSY